MDIEKSRPQLNEEQKSATFCNDNAVVAAGAGSGKTMVLANRFAWLLTEKGFKVDEILTLTFTTKAAAQMYRRIYSLLTEIAENEAGPRAERAKEAIDDFIHARIQTLDSYSASLVKQCASRYGISPDFAIDEDRCRNIALEESLPFLITNRHHTAIERLYSDKRPSDIVHNIFTDVLFNYCQIDEQKDFSVDVKKQFCFLCSEWKNKRVELLSILDEMDISISADNALLPDLVPLMESFKNEKFEFPEAQDIQNYFNLLLALPPESCIEEAESHILQKTLAALLSFLSDIYALNLQKGKKSNNPVKETIKKLRSIFGEFSSLAVSCMQAGFNISLMSLMTELQGRYLDRKRAEGVLTFKDIAGLSRTILLEQNDIRQSEKESFKAIMIDEFQDNNELQKDLLFLLAEKIEKNCSDIPRAEDLCPGKLFFVGDEKQSIYLFRGADVSVFRKLKEELKSKDLPLKINYRSAPQLIGAFNAIFGGSDFDPKGKAPLCSSPSVFAPGEKQTNLPIYEAAYTPLEAGKDGEGKLSVCILDTRSASKDSEDDDLLSADENEARFTAEKIRKLLEEKTKTGEKKYAPKDIALLFRTRSPQYLFEKHLRLLNIPYTCEDINDFFYGGLVNDIMSVLRLAAYPHDSASYAEMLRSPFAGLSLSGTSLCLAVLKKAENPQVFNEEPLAILDAQDREKYLCGQKIYNSVCAKAQSESISSLLNDLWHREGCRYETEWNPQTSVYREFFDYLFHLAAKADAENRGLAGFTDSMREFRDGGGRLTDIEIPLERPSAVHLLTIHKSKGLEFPVVFLCCCGKHSKFDTSEDVFYSDEAGVVLSPPLPSACFSIPNLRDNFFWEKASAEAKRKRTAELRRLLYVGMTRAEKELYLTGSLDFGKETQDFDNFSVKIKNYTETKCESKESNIEGDSIINNDTFFGLMLPAIASHISEKGIEAKSSFFNLEEIPFFTEEYVKNNSIKDSSFTNDQNGLEEFIKKIESFYEKAEVIQTPELRDNHITPVSLKDKVEIEIDSSLAGKGFSVNGEYSGEEAMDVFEIVDKMLASLSQNTDTQYAEKFNSGSFGTIAHICAEALLNAELPEFPANLAGSLEPVQIEAFLEAGTELARRFIRSPLGKVAEKALLRESEFSFRSLIRNQEGKEVFINGTVDLFFDDGDSIHVVDFKTDSREAPQDHVAQMSCYYHAVCGLFAIPAKKECRVWLYYLRTGHVVELTEKVKNFKLEQRAFL